MTATSPSQTVNDLDGSSGRFVFLALAPDTYTVSVTKANYQAASVPGQTVFADSTAVVAVHLVPALKTIAKTPRLGGGSLVRSVRRPTSTPSTPHRDKISALGGGGGLNTAYSAVASVPGAYVPFNQTGYFQSVHIRGGDYDQVGYEFDGVPVNRSFDNYPSSSAPRRWATPKSRSTPAPRRPTRKGEGLAGYINQVIKHRHLSGLRRRQSRNRRAGVLSQGAGRSRRRDAGPPVLVVHGRRRLQPGVQLLRQLQRCVVPVVARHSARTRVSPAGGCAISTVRSRITTFVYANSVGDPVNYPAGSVLNCSRCRPLLARRRDEPPHRDPAS